jgi:hypothetical protein
VLKIRVSRTISTSTLPTMVVALARRRKKGLNLKFLGIVKGDMDDHKLKNPNIKRPK